MRPRLHGRDREVLAMSPLVVVLALLVSRTWVTSANAVARGTRDVVLVGNAAAGTVSVLDGHNWKNLGSIRSF